MKTTVTSLEQYFALMDEWATEIGRFMMAFAECEWYTFQLITLAGTAEEQHSLNKLGVQDRADLARECALRSLQEHPDIARAFEQFATLNGRRKLIAHSTPMTQVYANGKTLKFSVEMRSARRSERSIALTELRALTRKARENAGELCSMMQALSKERS